MAKRKAELDKTWTVRFTRTYRGTATVCAPSFDAAVSKVVSLDFENDGDASAELCDWEYGDPKEEKDNPA